ncbi:MAG: hypothetical protein P4M14_04130 [Gammaproteobacteria bacterium]|nr:hypothetical protein [Gammaproteobacteria bacterium]
MLHHLSNSIGNVIHHLITELTGLLDIFLLGLPAPKHGVLDAARENARAKRAFVCIA